MVYIFAIVVILAAIALVLVSVSLVTFILNRIETHRVNTKNRYGNTH